MNLDDSPEEAAFRAEVRAFLCAQLTDELRRGQRLTTTVITEPKIALAWQRLLDRRGWAAPSWPVEHGGTGWTPFQIFIFEEECARAGAPKIWASGIGMVGPVIIGFGNAEQKARYLPRILNGDDYWCQGYSEPGAGSDLAALQMQAIAEGDVYVLNGTKIWTSHAHLANRMFALVRTDAGGRKQEGITFLLIDMDSPGITVRPIRTIGGDHELAQVFFDAVRVPQTNRVGVAGQGWSYGKYLLEFERGGSAAAARLSGKLSSIVAIVTSRDDGPAAAAALSARAARIQIDLDALAMTELRLMAVRQAGERPGPMSSLLKLRISELTQEIARLGWDALGDDALIWETRRPLFDVAPGDAILGDEALPVVSSYLNSRGYSIFGGSIEMQHDILAKSLLGL